VEGSVTTRHEGRIDGATVARIRLQLMRCVESGAEDDLDESGRQTLSSDNKNNSRTTQLLLL
jgi:hypothetical protein